VSFVHKSDHQAEIPGNIFWCGALAPRQEVLFFWYLVFTLFSSPRTEIITMYVGENISVGSTTYKTVFTQVLEDLKKTFSLLIFFEMFAFLKI